MSVHLQREIDKLKRSLLALCAMVEDQVNRSVKSLAGPKPRPSPGSRTAGP